MSRRSYGGDVAPEAQLAGRGLRGRSPGSVLIIGEVPGSLRGELVARRATLWEVDTLSEGADALALDASDVVLRMPMGADSIS